MDKVRFGRALGYGARHAARAVAQAVDAATTPSPSAAKKSVPPVERPAAVAGRATSMPDRVVQAQRTVSHVSKAATGAVKAAGAPVVKFSRVLFLQVSGVFFTLIAVATGSWLWKNQGLLHKGMHDAEAQKAFLVAGVFVLFAYFALSSFLRARRLDRR